MSADRLSGRVARTGRTTPVHFVCCLCSVAEIGSVYIAPVLGPRIPEKSLRLTCHRLIEVLRFLRSVCAVPHCC